MKYRGIIKGILLHLCVICSVAEGIILVLDWYNPYMDFSGHSSFVQWLLCSGIFGLAVLENISPAGQRRIKKQGKSSRKYREKYRRAGI